MKLHDRAFVLMLFFLAVALSIPVSGQKGGGKPMDPYSSASAFFYLVDQEDADLLDASKILEVSDPRMRALGYRKLTDRIVILSDDGDIREIPSAKFDGPSAIVNNAVLVIDDEGRLSTTTGIEGNTVNPIINLFQTPMPVDWMTDGTGVGRGWPIVVDSITREVNATMPSGYSYRPYLYSRPMFWLGRNTILLDDTSKQVIYNAPDDDADHTHYPIEGIDALWIKLNSPIGDLTGVTISCGWNANADDVIQDENISELVDGASTVTRILPIRGFKRGAPGEEFGVKVQTVSGGSARVNITLYGEVVYIEN